MLGSFDVDADEQRAPPKRALQLKAALHGLPPGALLPFDGSGNPDSHAYDDVALPADAIWIVPYDASIRDVHDIPPLSVIGQVGNHSYDTSHFVEIPSIALTTWKTYPHVPNPYGCELPPNPVYRCIPFQSCGESRPNFWCILKHPRGAIPRGAMFGSVNGHLEVGQDRLYDVKRYDQVTSIRWLLHHRWRRGYP